MASIFMAQSWHMGEQEMHRLTKVPSMDNPTTPGLSQRAARMLQIAPLLALGTLDSEGWPWTTLLGGVPGFANPLGGAVIGVRVDVDTEFDPVIEALIPRSARKEGVVRYDEGGKMVSGLAIDLMARDRVKIGGRLIAGAMSTLSSTSSDDAKGGYPGTREMQLGIRIDESLGNCPKYLNKKSIYPAAAHPKLLSNSPRLSMEALKLLAKADLFFMSSSQDSQNMDTNHRGGPGGFVRVISNGDSGAEIIYPEYSGNRLYQNLGNMLITPRAGIMVPNFENGDVLYLTGTTEILIGKDAVAILPHSNLAVKIKITAARFVQCGLPFRGIPDEMSPYNPNLRVLVTEDNVASKLEQQSSTAKLISRIIITPTISRYKFSISSPVAIKPGQWVAIDFSDDLDIGYSHMREDDPLSLNDDFIRTFTVSSPPVGDFIKQEEFELTLRLHGPVTNFLQRLNPKAHFEWPIRGFGGDFVIERNEHSVTPFVAGGVGITPLIGQLGPLDISYLRLFWIVKMADIEFVHEILSTRPMLARNATIFLTGGGADIVARSEIAKSKNATMIMAGGDEEPRGRRELAAITALGATVEVRRPGENDFANIEAEKWYICAGNPLRTKLLKWLEGRTVVYESFDY